MCWLCCRAAGRSGRAAGWPAVQPSPWAKQMKCLNVRCPTCPAAAPRTQSPLSLARRVTSLLLFFSAVPPFIRLTLISEIRITWSGEETLPTRQIYFQPRKKIKVHTGPWEDLNEVLFRKLTVGVKALGGYECVTGQGISQFAFCEMCVQRNCTYTWNV